MRVRQVRHRHFNIYTLNEWFYWLTFNLCLLLKPTFFIDNRTLRVVPLSPCPSCVTQTKTARKKWSHISWGREVCFLPPGFHTAIFYLTIFFRVTHDGPSERGTTHSLRQPHTCPIYTNRYQLSKHPHQSCHW